MCTTIKMAFITLKLGHGHGNQISPEAPPDLSTSMLNWVRLGQLFLKILSGNNFQVGLGHCNSTLPEGPPDTPPC